MKTQNTKKFYVLLITPLFILNIMFIGALGSQNPQATIKMNQNKNISSSSCFSPIPLFFLTISKIVHTQSYNLIGLLQSLFEKTTFNENTKHEHPLSKTYENDTPLAPVESPIHAHTKNPPLPLNSTDLWWNVQWLHRKELTINHSQVANDLQNFPVLVFLEADTDLANSTQDDGDDIVFTDKYATKLHHEIETYVNTTGHLIAWVNVTYISSTTNTTLYMYYGNATTASQTNPSGVWDKNYRLIHHFHETGSIYNDSTTYDNDGTNHGSTHTTSYINGGNKFDGTDDYIDCGNKNSLNINSAVTLEAWINRTGTGNGTYPAIINRAATGYNRYQLRYKTTSPSQLQFFIGDTSVYNVIGSDNDIPLNQWTHIAGRWDGSTTTLFINGIQQTNTGIFTGTPNVASAILEIGRYSASNRYRGYIDEIRISDTPRNNSWISTEYNNQHNPNTFYTIGSEEDRPEEPILTNEHPFNGEKGVGLFPILSIKVTDVQHDAMDIYFKTNASGSWNTIGSNLNVTDGTYFCENTMDINQNFTTYYWSINCTDSKTWVNQTYSFRTQIGPVTDPFAQGWPYCKQITIDHTKVSDDLTNFPILINITDTDLAEEAQVDGDDIIFMDDDGIAMQLSHEIEYFNDNSGQLISWVNITHLSSSVDTTLYMYYGNDDIESMQNKQEVWDTNYKMVQHLHETTGEHYDSTSNDNEGACINGTNQNVSGYINGADSFDGTNDWITCGNGSSLDITEAITLEAWVKRTGDGTGNFPSIISRSEGGDLNRFQLRYRPLEDAAQFFLRDTSGYVVLNSELDLQLHTWIHLTGSWNGTTMILYVNGVQVNTSTFLGTPIFSNSHLEIGRYTSQSYFAGYIDEIRVSNIARRTDWILTQYNNQHDPSSFYTIGIEETPPEQPLLSSEFPIDNSNEIPLAPTLQIYVTDYQHDSIDIYFKTNASGVWKTIGDNQSVTNGTISCDNTTDFSNFSTIYYWSVNATDSLGSNEWTNETYSFTTRPKDYLFLFTIDHNSHINYGCSYPLTYIFTIDEQATDLQAYIYDNGWRKLPEKQHTDSYSGIEAARFNYTENKAFISAAFPANTDNLFIKITDATNLSQNVTYIGIASYYDDSAAAVVFTIDDWYDRYHEYFMTAIDRCQMRNIWVTPGIITVGSAVYGGQPANRTDMQQQITEGFVEPASHSKYHLHVPYDEEQYGVQSSYNDEINGSKQNLITDLIFPQQNRRGTQDYLYAWIEPYGEIDATVRQKLGEYYYLCDRSTAQSSSYVTWDSTNNVYNRVGYSINIESIRDLATLNANFDNVCNTSGIYHMFGHARNNNLISGDVALHFNYISNRSDIWYVGFGQLYLYHYMQERNVIGHTTAILNQPPHLLTESPENTSLHNPVGLTCLQITADDINNDMMNITFMTNATNTWQTIGSNTSVTNGRYQQTYTFPNYDTTYWWSVNCTDTITWTNNTYTFTTRPENYPPLLSDPQPINEAENVTYGNISLNITVSDPDGHLINITFRTNALGNWETIGIITNQTNGTYQQNWTFDKINHIYDWSVNCSDGRNWTNQTYSFTTNTPTLMNPFDFGWQYRKKITIDHTKVACNLGNFPVLINITDSDIKNKSQPDGDDIVFTNGPGVATILAHEIEDFNATNGVLITWVNVTSLSSTVDTILYMYYGNADVESMQNKHDVWDTSYKIVHHLGNLSEMYADSTQYHNDATNYGSNHTQGYINGGNGFNGSGSYITCGNDASLDITTQVTLEAWVKRTGDGTGNFPSIISRAQTSGYDRYQLRYNPSLNVAQFFLGNSSYQIVNSNTDLPLHQWVHLVTCWDGLTMVLYVNGIQQTDTKTYNSTPDVAYYPLEIGRYTSLNYFEGYIDEIRISDTERTHCWVITEYNNQYSPSTFYTIGAEETESELTTYILPLHKNWNIISIPFNETKEKSSLIIRNNSINYTWDEAVNNNIIVQNIWQYNTWIGDYNSATNLTAGRGYWIWAYHNCDLILNSSSQEDEYLGNLEPGWNINGLPINSSINKTTLIIYYNGMNYSWTEATTEPDPLIDTSVFGWDSSYFLTNIFNPGHGYWIYSYKNCVIKKGDP